jgi:hypothetical protein
MIINHNIIPDSKKFKCGKTLATYLQHNGIPLLSMNSEDDYFFLKTDKLEKVLKNAPIWMRILKVLEL